MKRVLSDYLEIYNKFRTDGLSKLERKQRYTLLSEWGQTAYDDESVNISDIQDFWNSHNRICWNKLFISKVICPVIAADLEIGGYEGLKFLFQCFRGHDDSYVSSDCPLAVFANIVDISISRFSWQTFCLNKTPITLTRSNTSIIRSNIFLSSLYMRYLPVC